MPSLSGFTSKEWMIDRRRFRLCSYRAIQNLLQRIQSLPIGKLVTVTRISLSPLSGDFSEQERDTLRLQLQQYELDLPTNPRFQNLTTIVDLCRRLVGTRKSDDYYLINRYAIFILLIQSIALF
jgi:hypothetical protein